MKSDVDFSTSLAAAPEGRPARIAGLDTGPDDRGRLESMGLCVGRVVEVVQSGDPMIVRVLGTRIGLAAAIARCVRLGQDG
jgi:Fe2+ transport system protein FeoA